MPDSSIPTRQQLRHRRRSLSIAQQRQHSAAICRRLLRSRLWQQARRIGLYWPTDGEPDLLSLLQHPQGAQRRWLLPRIDPRAQCYGQMQLLPWQPGQRLRSNRWGIPEPLPGRPGPADLLLIPLLGFDASGTRLGMGAGYYDRYLGRQQRRPYCLGIAHTLQQCPAIPRQPWDIPLNAVLTEQGFIDCKEKPTWPTG